jgi:uncharacterized protein DUF6689
MGSTLTATVSAALCSATLAFAQLPPPPPPPTPPLPADPVPIELTVSGRKVHGTIVLPGGISADLTIAFENVVGLTPAALEATATLVNPLDPELLGRLPGPGVSIPAAFPVLIRVGPSPTSALSFAGIYTISLHTHNLPLDPGTPLSLFKSPDGGPFRDITRWEGRGSYRDDGGGGDFSEFLIGVDMQPIDGVIAFKFTDLQATLTDNAGTMPPFVLDTLQAFLSNALALYQSGHIVKAIAEIKSFSRYAEGQPRPEQPSSSMAFVSREQHIPDVWRANCGPIVNVAGLLRSRADTLAFSLDRKASQ